MRQSHRRVTCRDHGIAVEAEKRHGGREHAGALVLALVQELARGARDDGMHAALAEMRRRHHRAQGRLDRPPRIGEEVGDAGEGLVLLGVEDVQDRADQQRMAGLLPMIAALERAFRDRPARRRCSGRRAPPLRRGGLRAAGCRRRSRQSVGSNSSTRPKRARQPAVSVQFSPLMSWTIAEPGQVSSVGTTRPTPLPLRVGAKHSTCSGPSWRR